jgi:hypothetical protein
MKKHLTQLEKLLARRLRAYVLKEEALARNSYSSSRRSFVQMKREFFLAAPDDFRLWIDSIHALLEAGFLQKDLRLSAEQKKQ